MRTNSDKLLANLVHDLRQPLGTIEYSACYLEMLLEGGQAAVQQQMRVIQQQLEVASRLLSEATACMISQREGTEESLDLTNSETAPVT